ncbi:MAG: nitroreductase family protein, partial [Muribaculaceae bacterium]|nr:nitroreductase family protein [Muribaculaceae bacterium]
MKIIDDVAQEFLKNAAYMNILERTSVRRYTDKTVSDEQVSAILHAAMSAPSGVNRQPWEFVVINDIQTLKSLADALPYAKMVAQAPVAIVVCANKDRFLDGVDST